MIINYDGIFEVLKEAFRTNDYSIIREMSFRVRLRLIENYFSYEEIPGKLMNMLKTQEVRNNLFSEYELIEILRSKIVLPDDKYNYKMFMLKAEVFSMLRTSIQIQELRNLIKQEEYKENPDGIRYLFNSVFYSKATDEDIEEILSIIENKVNEIVYAAVASHIKSDYIKRTYISEGIRNLDYSGGGRTLVSMLVESLNEDKNKVIYLEDITVQKKLYGFELLSIIGSLSTDELRIKYMYEFLKKGLIKESETDSIICRLTSDELREDYLLKFSRYFKEEKLKKVLASFRNDLIKLKNIEWYVDEIGDDIKKLLASFNEDFLDIVNKVEISPKLFEKIMNHNLKIFHGFEYIGKDAQEELMDKIVSVWRLICRQDISINNLNILICKQAAQNFKTLLEEKPKEFPLSGNINPLIDDTDIEYILKHRSNPELLLYFNMMLKTLLNEYNKDQISDLFEILKNKNDISTIFRKSAEKSEQDMELYKSILGVKELDERDCKIILILKNLNITESNKDLFKLYFENIKAYCESKNIDILEVISNKDVEVFKKIYGISSFETLKESFRKKNKYEGGLLSQMSRHCLNIQQRNFVEEEKKRLTKSIIKHLILNDNGYELIIERRILSAIKNYSPELKELFEPDSKSDVEPDSKSDVDFCYKMRRAFEIIFPEYIRNKDLDGLSKKELGEILSIEKIKKLMSKDKRFSSVFDAMLPEEKESLPLGYFSINEQFQAQKILFQLVRSLGEDALTSSCDHLDSEVVKHLDTIISGFYRRRREGKLGGFEFFAFDELPMIDTVRMCDFIKYYEELYDKKIQPKKVDKNGKTKDAEFNVDNVEKFLDATNKLSLRSSIYPTVLGEEVIKNIKFERVKETYNFYIEDVSGRVYRTIPSVNGQVDDNGKKVKYRSYEVDDPEQLILGSRFKDSCCKIGSHQESTFKYINSSPKATIIAIEDENGQFMGRVYGYQIGNVLHFTRIYYKTSFDFEKVMTQIAEDHIKGSKGIDYVTVIPLTCDHKDKSGRYTEKNIIKNPGDVNFTEDYNLLVTDHSIVEEDVGISVLASRNPIEKPEDIKFKRETQREVFYKKRSKKISVKDNLKKARSICLRSSVPEFEQLLEEADRIIAGDDWVIVFVKNECPVIIKTKYEKSIEGEEYEKMVDKEIADVLGDGKKATIGEGENNAKNRKS